MNDDAATRAKAILRAQLQASLSPHGPSIRLANCDGRYRVYPDSGMHVLVAYTAEGEDAIRTVYGTTINGVNHRVLYADETEAQRKADYLNARMQ